MSMMPGELRNWLSSSDDAGTEVDSTIMAAVSYTHLTLPTIYSV